MRVNGRTWAYAGAALGGIVSVAANVAHSYVPPPLALATWSPHGGAVIGAVFWPVALLVAVEILARTTWPTERRWVAVRYLGLLPVGLVAAVVSYRHLSGLLAFYGEDGLTATLGPLAVDGLMVMATGALIATASAPTASEPGTGTDSRPDNPADTAGVAEPVASRPPSLFQPGPDTTPTVPEAQRHGGRSSVSRKTPGVGKVRRPAPRRGREELEQAGAAFLAEHPDASARALAAGIGCRWETARDLLSALRPSRTDTGVRANDEGQAA